MEGLWVKHYEFTKWIILACVFITDGLWEEFCWFRFDQLNIVSGGIPSPPRAVFLCVSVGFSLPTQTAYLLVLEEEYETVVAAATIVVLVVI